MICFERTLCVDWGSFDMKSPEEYSTEEFDSFVSFFHLEVDFEKKTVKVDPIPKVLSR